MKQRGLRAPSMAPRDNNDAEHGCLRRAGRSICLLHTWRRVAIIMLRSSK
jgi:hypothetical protein